MWTLNASTSGLIPKRNCLKFLTLQWGVLNFHFDIGVRPKLPQMRA